MLKKEVISAGCAVFDASGTGRVLLVHGNQTEPDFYGMPKGWVEENEPLTETASREVLQETGFLVLAGAMIFIGQVEYEYVYQGENVRKSVYWFTGIADTNVPVAQKDNEFFEAVWVSASEALTLLTYDTEKNILTDALKYRDHI